MKNIKIVAMATKSDEFRAWSTYEEFIKDTRFFWSSGAPDKYEGGAEDTFEKIVDALDKLSIHEAELSIVRGGLKIMFVYEMF